MEDLIANDAIEPLEGTGKWHARSVAYYRGTWKQLSTLVPEFRLEDFRAEGGDVANPYMKTVVRIPRTVFEKPVPVATVSNTYCLAQHHAVAAQCFRGISDAGIDPNPLQCELGITQLGEWANLRVYFPERYSFKPRKDDSLNLRLECCNSVDGSSRLLILLGWLRLVCTNGMIIRETKTEVSDIHNNRLNIEVIPGIVTSALKVVNEDVKRMNNWLATAVVMEQLKLWANKEVSNRWGKKAACRVFHICLSGFDVEITDPFAEGDPTDKPTKPTVRVPGSPEQATNLFDVSQALAWVATNRNNAEERLDWQAGVPHLMGRLAQSGGRN